MLVPVHRGYVGYAGGNFDVWFYVLYGRVVCRAGVPNRVVEDDGCVCASGIIMLWFVVVWVGEGFASETVVLGVVLEGYPDAPAKNFACRFDWWAVSVDVFNVVGSVLAEKTGVGVWGGASGGGGVGVTSPHFGGEGIENEGALVVPYVRGHARDNISAVA